MKDLFDYNFWLDQAFKRIRTIRDPHSGDPVTVDFEWNSLDEQMLFNYGGRDFRQMCSIIENATDISVSILSEIVYQLSNFYKRNFRRIDDRPEIEGMSDILFTFFDPSENTILFFKNKEKSLMWKEREPDEIISFLEKNNAKKCLYVYLLFDKAYLQIIGHNHDETDPGRGYNFYSITWFITHYFGDKEGERFISAITTYETKVNDYLGYTILKTLTPSTLINFRTTCENAITNFPYDSIMKIKLGDKLLSLSVQDYIKLREQFIDKGVYLVLIGNRDFAESLITAEWLYVSMKKAQAVDLTVIGMGYFKAVEQLLFDLICLHKNEKRKIRRNFSRDDLPNLVDLNDTNIMDNAIDSTIGTMATFVKKNMDMMRNDILAKDYVKEAIFAFAKKRNGYFHKDNIHLSSIIDEIRALSLQTMFLLLGAFDLPIEHLELLGLPQKGLFDDYYRLCEYINYHAGEPLLLKSFDGQESWFIAWYDMNYSISDGGIKKYTGIYFKEIGAGMNIVPYRITRNNLPKEIYIGKLIVEPSREIHFYPAIVRKIFDDGHFIPPTVAGETSMTF